ncbi:MAG TPA: M14 family zinc carboxypeptidase [Melioribacteraceae bacterium]|nr:M14 family zinc carboxypeptidase [Melioribacteraceae bacterium]
MDKKSIFFVLFVLILSNVYAQSFPINDLYNTYDNFKDNRITIKRFTHSDLLPIIKEKANNKIFKFEQVGKSIEGRSINKLTIGKGDITVLAWSQMHGDEATATMALLDLFNFFENKTQFTELKELLLNKLTIHFIPMVNPDGAEKFTRRNRAKIDLNRDALRRTNPESKILYKLQKKLKPKFGFNLHDQGSLYTAGNTFKTATISVLLPAYNINKDINEVRSNGMKVIVDMHKALNKFIPGHIGRYDDEFEPRAFGDNFVKWGTSSILIESGGWKDDYEKQFVRKLNYLAILTALHSIATNNYNNNSIDDYFAIPENSNMLFDMLLRNVKTVIADSVLTVDIGINRNEITDKNKKAFFKSSIVEFGDLSTFFGNDEFCFDSMTVVPGKVYDTIFDTIEELENINFEELLSSGYCYIKVKNIPKNLQFTKYPINIVLPDFTPPTEISLGNSANFVILENNKTRYTIINGFLYDILIKKSYIYNSVIFK